VDPVVGHGSRQNITLRVCVAAAKAPLESVRTLDVGCGTGFLTGELPGAAAGLDDSEQMLEIARKQVPQVQFIQGDATSLPFADGSFERVFASVLCTHLEPGRGPSS
jgi:ubiquinone/menaquinone biosynthesis C-methylase UbiE